MKQILLITFCLLALTGFAQQERPAAKNKEAVKQAMEDFINQELQLSEAEQTAFWPSYSKYRDEMAALRQGKGKPRLELMSDSEAEAFIDNHFVKEEKKLALRKSLYQDLKGKVGIRKLAALQQAEQKFKRQLLHRYGKRGNGNRGGRDNQRGPNGKRPR